MVSILVLSVVDEFTDVLLVSLDFAFKLLNSSILVLFSEVKEIFKTSKFFLIMDSENRLLVSLEYEFQKIAVLNEWENLKRRQIFHKFKQAFLV